MSRTHTERSDTVTQFYLQITKCFASVHQMAPRLTEVEGIWLELSTHLSTLKGWKAEFAWLADLLRMAYPHIKWLPISYRSSAGYGCSRAERPTFYNCLHSPKKYVPIQADIEPSALETTRKVAPSVQRRKVWLAPNTKVSCSNAAKTRNPLKFAGAPQTNETISAAKPKFTIF